MNNTNEEEFKKSLNDILNSKEFEFDEANWQGAKKLIDEAKQKRRFALYFILPLFLLIPLVSYFLFFNEQSETKTITEQPALEPTKAIVVQSKPETLTGIENKLPVNKKESLQNEKPELPKAIAEVKVENEVNKKPATKPLAPLVQSKVNSALAEVTLPTVVKQMPEPIAETRLKEANTNPVIEKDKSGTDKLPEARSQSETPVVLSENLNTAGAIKEDELLNQGTPVKEPKQGPTQPSSPNNENSQPSNPTIVKENPLINLPENRVEEKNKAESPVVSTVSPLPEPFNTPPLKDSLLLSERPEMPDTTTSVTLLSKDPCAVRDKVVVELGMNYTFGWNYNEAREAAGINPVLGVLYSNKLNKKITASAGLRYTTLSRLQLSSKTSKITTYKLGEESDVTVITPQKVYYISIPLQLAYQLNCNNQIGVGYNLDFMINTNSTVETYHLGIKKETNYRSTKSLGYQEGFKSVSSRVSLIYRRRIYKELWLSAEATFGLTDLKDNTFFEQQAYERNTGFGLSLMYNFLKQ